MHELQEQFELQVLMPGCAPLWFEAVSDDLPSPEDVRSMERLLEMGSFKPHLHVVVKKGGRPFGRMPAQVKDGCIRIWIPDFHGGTEPDEALAAMRTMIASIATYRRQAGQSRLAIESRPGNDLRGNGLWLRALKQEGYAEICAYRVYTLSLQDLQMSCRGPDGLSISNIDDAHEPDLLALYRRTVSQTLQQRGTSDETPEEKIAIWSRVGRGRKGGAWLLARIDDAPLAYALANFANESGFEGLSAWIVEIGCVPEQRRKGIASVLLAEVAKRVRSGGARQLLAAIDEVNIPSIRLHQSLGFQPVPGRHYIYRRAA